MASSRRGASLQWRRGRSTVVGTAPAASPLAAAWRRAARTSCTSPRPFRASNRPFAPVSLHLVGMSSPSPAPRSGSVRTKLVVNTILALSFLLISAPLVSGVPLHEWISIAFVAVVVAHVVLSWNWVVSVTRRFLATLRGQVRFNYVWDLLLYLSFIVATVSGLAVSEAALPAIGIPFERDRFWTLMHKVSGFGMMSAAGVHLAMHWQWVTAAVVRLLRGRLPSAPSRAGGATWWLGPTVVLSLIILVTSVASYAAGSTGIADRVRAGGDARRSARNVAGEGGAAGAAGTAMTGADSAARAARREEVMRRRREREAAGAPVAGAPGSATTRPGGRGNARPARPSLALRSYRTAREIGLFMGLPFVLTLGVLAVARRARRSDAREVDPLDESGA